jgi:hypothetical protein
VVDHVKAVDGIDLEAAQGRRWGRRRIRVGQDDAGAGDPAADLVEGPISFVGKDIEG